MGAGTMHRAPSVESNQQSADDRGADASAPRSTPLAMVSGAVAGDDLQSVAISASDAIGRPVLIAIPALGEPVMWPPESITPADVQLIVEHAADAIRRNAPKDTAVIGQHTPNEAPVIRGEARKQSPVGREDASNKPPVNREEASKKSPVIREDASNKQTVIRGDAPRKSTATPAGDDSDEGPLSAADSARGADALADEVPVWIGRELIGIVAATVDDRGTGVPPSEHRAWLEGAAAAAAVTALMREARNGDVRGSRRALLQAIGAGPPADIGALLDHARRLGIDLSSGAIAICAQAAGDQGPGPLDDLVSRDDALLAEMGDGRVLGLLPIASTPPADSTAAALTSELATRGMDVASSAPRRDPSALHEALREAELLLELTASPDGLVSGQEETHRLLIGVLLRDPEELELLRARTISPLIEYDAEHETELAATLQAFLVHHGSTTETAEAMNLHRHTVGYRLARVHEVSGLSPYESDGRERLSLGLKADQILAAERRRTQHE